jgi:flagellar assembly protein FliH
LSKIYKSSYVNIGSPKPVVNIFNIDEKHKADTTAITDEESNSISEDDANSIIEDAKEMYIKIIEEANSEAYRIVEAAESEAGKLLATSREQGYKDGLEKGYIDGRSEARSVIDEAIEIREYLNERKESLYKETEGKLLSIVISIAKKVIGEELTQNKEAILSLINQALQKCAFKKNLVLKISPEDSDFIIENKTRIIKLVEGISDIDIVSDLSLTKGSCIIETPSGEINSSIDVQINEIEKVFNYLYKNE